jgi:hypothetical protein
LAHTFAELQNDVSEQSVLAVQVVRQALVDESHVNIPHDVVVIWHAALVPLQLACTAPSALHEEAHSASGSVFALTGAQVPLAPPVLAPTHASH